MYGVGQPLCSGEISHVGTTPYYTSDSPGPLSPETQDGGGVLIEQNLSQANTLNRKPVGLRGCVAI